jgi:hypothetical protein
MVRGTARSARAAGNGSREQNGHDTLPHYKGYAHGDAAGPTVSSVAPKWSSVPC